MYTISVFIQDPHSSALRNHSLSGEYVGYRSIDITGDRRIVFRQVTPDVYEVVELVDIGTHSQLYG